MQRISPLWCHCLKKHWNNIVMETWQFQIYFYCLLPLIQFHVESYRKNMESLERILKRFILLNRISILMQYTNGSKVRYFCISPHICWVSKKITKNVKILIITWPVSNTKNRDFLHHRLFLHQRQFLHQITLL